MDNRKNLMIQSALFGVAFIAYFLMTLLLSQFLWEQWLMIKDESEEIKGFILKFIGFYSVVSISAYACSAVVLGWGLFSSLRRRLTMRKSGIIFSVFFIIGLFSKITQALMGTNLNYLLPSLLQTLLMVIAIFLYFIKNRLNPVFVYIMCGWYLVDVIISFIQKVDYEWSAYSVINICGTFAGFCLAALISFQTYYTHRRNSNT